MILHIGFISVYKTTDFWILEQVGLTSFRTLLYIDDNEEINNLIRIIDEVIKMNKTDTYYNDLFELFAQKIKKRNPNYKVILNKIYNDVLSISEVQ